MKRFLLAALIIVCSAAVATVAAGLLQLKELTDALNQSKKLQLGNEITPAAAGDPQTILLIGSDKRARGAVDAKDPPHSDTIMLVRLDPHKSATTLLSVPRDLKVTIYPRRGAPTTQKINAAYTIGGVKLALATVKRVLGIKVNHVVDVSFKGFGQAVNAIGCVYVDVDRRYFNDNAATVPGQNYATINIQPGYQRLCGQRALDYARFRHADTDLVRAARQQGFLRQAKEQVGVAGLIDKRSALERIFGRNTQTDVHSTTQVLRLLKLLVVSLGHPVRQVRFEGQLGPSYVTASVRQIHLVVHEFLSGGAAASPRRAAPRRDRARHTVHTSVGVAGATAADQTNGLAVAHHVPFALYFPRAVIPGSRPDELRVYSVRDEQGKLHRAYRIVVPLGLVGEYYGVQGTNWLNPPILTQPSQTRRIRGHEYELFYDGPRLKFLAWRTPRAVYWISNTLTDSLSNGQMLAIAASTRPIH